MANTLDKRDIVVFPLVLLFLQTILNQLSTYSRLQVQVKAVLNDLGRFFSSEV